MGVSKEVGRPRFAHPYRPASPRSQAHQDHPRIGNVACTRFEDIELGSCSAS
jgi:hypothetical protein